MRNAGGVTNLTARPVSVEQLATMLRGSPVASLVPEDDSTTPPIDVQIGTRRVRVQVGRRGAEVLVRLSRPEGPATTQPMARIAEPAPQQRPKAQTGMSIRTPAGARAKPATKGPAGRAKTATGRAQTPTSRPKTQTGAGRAKTSTRTKKPTAAPRKSQEIELPSPASLVGGGRTQPIAVAEPASSLTPSGLFEALDLDDGDVAAAPPLSIDVDAPTQAPNLPLPIVSVEATLPVTSLSPATSAAPTASGELASLVTQARERGASDLHIAAARMIAIRVGGDLTRLGSAEALSAAQVEALLRPLLSHEMSETLSRVGYIDFALAAPDGGRLRTNICRQQQGLKATFRLALPAPLPLDKLGLPPEVAKVVAHHQGLVVIAGPSGHGKTTTLAALVDLVNSTKPYHILTIEDPVELVHTRKMAVISQREVGRHTTSFARGLKASLREDPDVIVIGELRDRESVEIALTAAETGHLVLATMSTPSAAKTIDRLIDMFPPEEHSQVRASVAGALRAIVAQRLLPKKGGGGVVPAIELVTGVLPLAVMIREDKMYQLPNLMQRGRAFGMIRLEESIAELVRAGKIDDDGKTQPLWRPQR
jgi:twitching motility protein PilT